MELHLVPALWIGFLGLLGFEISRLLYNIFFHPLRAFPGPVAARASKWWKAYIELVGTEQTPTVLKRLHEQYGEVIRVGPSELHFGSPSTYHEIYNQKARWAKDPAIYQVFGKEFTSFTYRSYSDVKHRRDILSPAFSRRSILEMQGLIREKVDHLTDRIAEIYAAGYSSDLLCAYRCFAIDTVSTFCFSTSISALDSPHFQSSTILSLDRALPSNIIFRHFPLFGKVLFRLPSPLATLMSSKTDGLRVFRATLERQVREFIADPKKLEGTRYPTIYNKLMDPTLYEGGQIPAAEQLFEEAQTIVWAGANTVGDALMMGTFHIIDHPNWQKQLRAELSTVWPVVGNPPSLEVLEALPLLAATVKEVSRMAPGATSSPTRIVPATGATIAGVAVPGGTIVGMSSILVHKSASVFKDPERFNPERWLEKDSLALEHYLLPYGRGPRSCLGMHLANAELCLGLAAMVRRFEMEVDWRDFGREDLVWRDCFAAHYPGRHLRAWCRPVKD